ncbi:MAG: hypothetical protein KDA31_14310 [Phycisphaerales bacterium]|nr:hypothetical protein [Phycisphaerales bacterium]MCB9835531.1 hypothetical protein [Phycisphaera sp.]
MATRSNQQTKTIDPAQADSIAESKLARIQLIAKEALDLLGEDSPEVLRKNHAEAVAVMQQQVTNLEARLAGAAEQIKSVEGELRHAQRVADDRLQEAEKVWDVAAEQAQTIKKQQTEIESRDTTITERETSITELKGKLDAAGTETRKLHDEIRSQKSQADSARAALEQKITELTDQIDEHEASLAKLGSELARASEERDDALTQIEENETELSRMRDELADLSARLTESTQAATALRAQLDEVQSRAASSEAIADELEGRISVIQGQLTELSQSEEAAHTDLAEARSEIADLSGRLAEKDQTIARLSQQPNRAPAQIEQKPLEVAEPISVPAEIQRLRDALDAKETEAEFMREQMDRADERADKYRDRAQQAKESLEKANAIVMRARRRATARTQQYSETIEAMSALHVKYDVMKGELRELEARANRHLLIARLCGAAAALTGLLAIISAF